MSEKHRQQALDYLSIALSLHAPPDLTQEAVFEGQPLEREGDMSVFSFRAGVGGQEEQGYYVVAGQTDPNYYPEWGLTPEQIYDLHLGTRFMLVMKTSSFPLDKLPGDLPERIERFIGTVAPGARVRDVAPAAAFNIESDVHAICRATIAGESVYVIGLDAPPGIYRDVHLPPHVVFRRHIGQLIRREAQDANQ